MNVSRPLRQASRAVYDRAYGPIMRHAGWLITHSGPLTPILLRYSTRLHNRLMARAHGSTAPNPVCVDGLSIYHTGHPVLARMMASGIFEPHVTRLFKEIVKPGMTVVDVGANVGYYSLLAGRLVGEQGTVWAFEPAPHVVELLRGSIAANGFESRVHPLPQAVSNRQESAQLCVNVAEPFLSSLYPEMPAPGTAATGETVEVECTTLDIWAAQRQWPPVDLVKIDIEGGEKPALEGMVQMSQRSPSLKLIVEFNVTALRAAATTPDEFFAAVHACGFTRISVIGERHRVLRLPTDIPWLLREIPRRIPGDSVNLLCEKMAVGSPEHD